MLTGTMYFTTDINIINNSLNATNVCILDLNEMGSILDPNHPKVIPATLLLPPPDALLAEIDGNLDLFQSIYLQHLFSDDVIEFIAVILLYLLKSGHVILFISQIPEDSVWLNTLLNYFKLNNGIQIGLSLEVPYFYDIRFNSTNSNILYLCNCINANEYLMYDDPNVLIPPETLSKLMYELQPLIDPGVDPELYFMKIKEYAKVNFPRFPVHIKG